MEKALQELVAKDAIRELAMLYSRGCDRKDIALLRTLYTADATDSHDVSFDGPADEYVDFLERSVPYMRYSGHHICNHLIAVDVEAGTGEGEIYALAWHIIPDRANPGAWIEDFMCVRYIDRYAKEADGRWRFAQRVVTYDMRTQRPHEPHRDAADPAADPSYATLAMRLFQAGSRA